MENQKLKTKLKLTKEQLQNILTEHMLQQDGASEVFQTLVNALMMSERHSLLKQKAIQGTNKANGYRKATKPGLGTQLQLDIPRDRMGLFKPLILGILNQHEDKVKNLSFALYGKGLTNRQIADVLAEVYGKDYSKSTVNRMSSVFYKQVTSWLSRKLDDYYPVVFVDAIHLKVRRDVVATQAFYIVLGLKSDFTREILAVVNMPTESASGWQAVLGQLQERGGNHVGLFVFDDLKGLDMTIGKLFADSERQKCVLHLQRNLSSHVRVKDRASFCQGLQAMFNPDRGCSISTAVSTFQHFLNSWSARYPYFGRVSNRLDLPLYFTYLGYNYRVRRMLYTTNWIERFNKSVRRTTKVRNALPSPNSALVLIGYVGMEMEQGAYKYPISNFKYEESLIKQTNC